MAGQFAAPLVGVVLLHRKMRWMLRCLGAAQHGIPMDFRDQGRAAALTCEVSGTRRDQRQTLKISMGSEMGFEPRSVRCRLSVSTLALLFPPIPGVGRKDQANASWDDRCTPLATDVEFRRRFSSSAMKTLCRSSEVE